jgi:hypothetical protein
MSNPSKPTNNDKPATLHTNNHADMMKRSILSSQTLVPTLPDETINRQNPREIPLTQTHLVKPDQTNITAKLTQISINGINYNIDFLSSKNRRDTAIAAEFLVKVTLDPQAKNITNQTNQLVNSESKLVNLAKIITFELPQAVKQLVIDNNINFNQLKQLSSRNEGYLLPNAQLIGKKLILSNNLIVPLPSSITLPPQKTDSTSPTHVLPSIHFNSQKWYLSLKPIISEIDIKLSLIDTSKRNDIPISVEKPLTIAKPDIARLYSNLMKPLENISINKLLLPELSGSQLAADESKQTLTKQDVFAKPISTPEYQNKNATEQVKSHTKEQLNLIKEIQFNAITQSSSKVISSSDEYSSTTQKAKQTLMLTALNNAFGKAGSLPTTVENKEIKDNLASQLSKLIPHINPTKLFALADPHKIREELLGQLNLNTPVDVNSLIKPSLSNMSSISILFHLLLGVKNRQFTTEKADGKIKATQDTLNYFQKLQQKMATSNTLLALLEKAGTTETTGKLISNLSLYSQASSDTNGLTNWYFTLPYSLNRHQDNLEGHFTQEDNDDGDKPTSWKLQLKFNLLQGPILIQAKVIENRMSMTIKVENSELQNRIDSLLPPLIKKLSAIGLTPDKVSTQHSKIPASLLPGEHYLVKIKA